MAITAFHNGGASRSGCGGLLRNNSRQLLISGWLLLASGIFGCQKATGPVAGPTPPQGKVSNAAPLEWTWNAPAANPAQPQPTLQATFAGDLAGPVISVALSVDGKALASVGVDGTVKLFDVAVAKQRAVLFKGDSLTVKSVAFSGDGKLLASGCGMVVKLWDVATAKEKATFDGHTSRLQSVAFSGNGKVLASGGLNEIKLWDVATGKETASLKHHRNVMSVALSGDGKLLASAGQDGALKLWDVATDREIAITPRPGVRAVAFSGDGKSLASGSRDGTVTLWDVTTVPLRPRLVSGTANVKGDAADMASSVTFSGDGTLLAATTSLGAGDRRVWVVDVAAAKEKANLMGQNISSLNGVALNGDGTRLAVAAGDALYLWDLPAPKKADE
jgi:WD40 repeat protein